MVTFIKKSKHVLLILSNFLIESKSKWCLCLTKIIVNVIEKSQLLSCIFIKLTTVDGRGEGGKVDMKVDLSLSQHDPLVSNRQHP